MRTNNRTRETVIKTRKSYIEKDLNQLESPVISEMEWYNHQWGSRNSEVSEGYKQNVDWVGGQKQGKTF